MLLTCVWKELVPLPDGPGVKRLSVDVLRCCYFPEFVGTLGTTILPLDVDVGPRLSHGDLIHHGYSKFGASGGRTLPV